MQAALAGLPGVRRAEVDLATGQAWLELEAEGAPADEELVRAVEEQVVAPRLRRLLSSLPFARRFGHGHREGGEP